jgi:hypothetical protein
MVSMSEFDVSAAHRYFSAECFNRAWTLMDKAERSLDEDRELVALGQASLWHWSQRADCTDTNLSIGLWLLSRIYAVVGEAGQSRLYAEACRHVSQREGVEPFYLAYAHEALARAAALSGDGIAAAAALTNARALVDLVTDAESRSVLLADLATVRSRG